MGSTDFFDDDLLQKRGTAKPVAAGKALPVAGVSASAVEGTSVRSISDFNLTRMARHRDELNTQEAMAAREMDGLKQRNDELERERRTVQEMLKRQDEYDRGKLDMMDRLRESVAILEKQEIQATRLSELYAGTSQRFKELLLSLEGINEDAWPDESVRDEVNKYLVIIEDIRKEYSKSMAKIEATEGAAPATLEIKSVMLDAEPRQQAAGQSLAHWFRVGFAVSLPLMAFLLILFVVALVAMRGS